MEKLSAVLERFERIDPNTLVPSEPQWSEPRTVEISGPHDPSLGDGESLTVAVSYKLPTLNDR